MCSLDVRATWSNCGVVVRADFQSVVIVHPQSGQMFQKQLEMNVNKSYNPNIFLWSTLTLHKPPLRMCQLDVCRVLIVYSSLVMAIWVANLSSTPPCHCANTCGLRSIHSVLLMPQKHCEAVWHVAEASRPLHLLNLDQQLWIHNNAECQYWCHCVRVPHTSAAIESNGGKSPLSATLRPPFVYKSSVSMEHISPPHSLLFNPFKFLPCLIQNSIQLWQTLTLLWHSWLTSLTIVKIHHLPVLQMMVIAMNVHAIPWLALAITMLCGLCHHLPNMWLAVLVSVHFLVLAWILPECRLTLQRWHVVQYPEEQEDRVWLKVDETLLKWQKACKMEVELLWWVLLLNMLCQYWYFL
jgi:hypothetical protein